jgi:uncharacterized membrane protein YkvA (DUF1232 family)
MATVNETHVEIELNASERGYYDRVRERLRPVGRSLDSDVRDLLLLLPDLTMLMFRLLRDDRVAVGDKAVMLLGLGYVLSPIDILPAFFFGPLGLLDDLVVVAATLSRLINHVHPDVVRSHWSGQGDALRAIQRVTDWSEHEIGGRVRRVLRGLRG